MMFLEIGGYNFSPYVNKRKYDIEQEEETVSWKDANSIIHTTVLRTRVKGSIELNFVTEEYYSEFMKIFNSACEDGYWDITLYVNNTHEEKTITARIEKSVKPVFGNHLVYNRPVVNSVKLEIEEV